VQTYKGSCHCGAVVFRFQCTPIVDGLRCNCSYCRRQAQLLSTKLRPQDLEVVRGREALTLYLWGDRVCRHQFCRICGVYVFYEHEAQCRVNLGCVEGVDPWALEERRHDGESMP
jgi:hypothetical protein